MAVRSQACPECRALVEVASMAAHVAWHSGLSNVVATLTTATAANHPHGPVTAR